LILEDLKMEVASLKATLSSASKSLELIESHLSSLETIKEHTIIATEDAHPEISKAVPHHKPETLTQENDLEPEPTKDSSSENLAKSFLASLKDLFEIILKKKLGLEDKLPIFITKASSFLDKVPDNEWKGETGCRFLCDFLQKLIQIHSKYIAPPFNDLRKKIDSQIQNITTELEQRGIQVIPTNSQITEVEKDLFDFVSECSAKPKASLLRIEKFSFKKDSSLITRGIVIISNGIHSKHFDFLRTVEQIIMLFRENYASESWSTNLKNIRKWLHDLSNGKANNASLYMRNTINLLAQMEGEIVQRTIKDGIKILEDFKVLIIPVKIGNKFDESFSPKKFERRLMEGKGASGTVVKIISYGYMDDQGIVMQKAVVGVAK